MSVIPDLAAADLYFFDDRVTIALSCPNPSISVQDGSLFSKI
jgi:hypothetical protein